MLVLSRQENQRIMIGHDIVLTVVQINRDKVRIGIDAPPDVIVHREEIYHAIQRENVAEACCDARGLAGAKAEMDYHHKSYQPPQDDQPLIEKMEDGK